MQNTERKSAFDLLMRNSKLKFEQKNATQQSNNNNNKNECPKKCEVVIAANTNQNDNSDSSDDVIFVDPSTPVSNNQNESTDFDQNKKTELLNALHVRQLDEKCDSFIEKNCCLKLNKSLKLNKKDRVDDDSRENYVNSLLKTLKFVNINGNNDNSCDNSSHIIDCEKVTSNIDVEYVTKYYENNDYWIELYNKISKRYANSEEANINAKQELNNQQSEALMTTTNTNVCDAKMRRSKRRKTESTEQQRQQEQHVENIEKKSEDNVKEKETSKVESILWTEKYQFKDENDFICNKSQLERLKQWLEQWKNKLKNVKSSSNGNDNCDSTNEDSDFAYDSDCSSNASSCCDSKQLFRNNALLINGPYGCGKTTAVYCVAQQLGFKVFEVNTSNYRNKAQVLQDLIGVLSSHHVVSNKKQNTSEVNNNNNNINNNSNGPGKKVLKKAVQTKNSNTLDSFFKKSSNKDSISTSLTAVALNSSRKRRNIDKIDCLPLFNHDENANMCNELTINKEENKTKIDILKESLILFDDIDIVLKDDQGFWSVINFFIKKSKKPIILTCNDNYILNKIDLNVEQIKFNKPDINHSSNYLKTIALCERIQIKNVKNLHDILNTNNCDLRNSLLQLQLSAALHKTEKKQQNILKTENASKIFRIEDLFQELHYIYYLENEKNKLFNNNLTGKLVDNRVKRFDTCIFKPGLSDTLSFDKYVDSKKNITEQIVEYTFTNNENSENLIEIYDTYNKFTCKEPITNQIMHKFAASQHKLISNKSVYTDYAPYLRAICKYEQLKQELNLKRRFLHYLNTTSNIGLNKDDYAILARENVFSESTIKPQVFENKLDGINMLNNNSLTVNSNTNSIYNSQYYDNLYDSY